MSKNRKLIKGEELFYFSTKPFIYIMRKVFIDILFKKNIFLGALNVIFVN